MILQALKTNAAAGYQGPVKIELLKGAGLLRKVSFAWGKLVRSLKSPVMHAPIICLVCLLTVADEKPKMHRKSLNNLPKLMSARTPAKQDKKFPVLSV